ncbi:MAG: peptidoglycan editing factor PgeF [Cetobacterium sp.]|nr:peptidoglycan editing factor PgeF [Cetobacterium sp.]
MFKNMGEYYILEEFEKYGIRAIYTNKNFGNVQNMDIRKKLLKDNKTFIFGKQTHSKNIVAIGENSENFYDNTDGFVSSRKDIMIFTQYADCLPIYFYDKEKKIIGLCHSGWSGTFKEIGRETLKIFLEKYGSKKEDILIGFGIGISWKNYEVGREFYENFKEKFSEKDLKEVFYFKDTKIFFDNQRLNKNLMISYGIEERNIIENDLCTFEGTFHSYRRDKQEAGRNGAYIYFD